MSLQQKILALFLSVISLGLIAAELPPPKTNYAEMERQASPQMKAELNLLRKRISDAGLNMGVGATEAMFQDIASLTGALPEKFDPRALKEQLNANQAIDDLIKRLGINANCPPAKVSSSHARKANFLEFLPALPPIRNQNPCGSCWAHNSLASVEIGYALQDPNRDAPASRGDLSEQQLLSACFPSGSCQGAHTYDAFDYILTNGIQSESERPYTARYDNTCPTVGGNNRILSYAPLPARGVNTPGGVIPVSSESDIKKAIAETGSVTVYLCVRDAFQGYNGVGVLQDLPNPTTCRNRRTGRAITINHAVNLVGWNDKMDAWVMRNSWGTNWGANGYAYLKKGDFNMSTLYKVNVERTCQRQSKNWELFDAQRRGILDELNDRMKRYR